MSTNSFRQRQMQSGPPTRLTMSQLQRRVIELEKSLKDQGKELHKARLANGRARTDSTVQVEQAQALAEEVTTLTKDKQTLTQSLITIRQQVAGYEAQVNPLLSGNKDLTDKVNILQTEKESLQKELERCSVRCNELIEQCNKVDVKEFNKLQTISNTLRVQLNKRREDHTAEVSELQKKNNEMSEEIERISGEKSALLGNANINSIKAESTRTKMELTIVTSELKSANALNAQLKADLEQVKQGQTKVDDMADLGAQKRSVHTSQSHKDIVNFVAFEKVLTTTSTDTSASHQRLESATVNKSKRPREEGEEDDTMVTRSADNDIQEDNASNEGVPLLTSFNTAGSWTDTGTEGCREEDNDQPEQWNSSFIEDAMAFRGDPEQNKFQQDRGLAVSGPSTSTHSPQSAQHREAALDTGYWGNSYIPPVTDDSKGCKHCGTAKFASGKVWHRHVRQCRITVSRSQVATVECPECPRKFSRPDVMKVHCLSAHKIELRSNRN